MKEYATFIETDTLRFERLLPGPIERVWAYLTESEKKAQWLAAGDVEPRVGGSVTLDFDHDKLSNEEDPIPEKFKDMEGGTRFTGRVITYDPPNKLSYTWGEPSGEESEVTFELIPKGEQVLLRLTHRYLGDDRDLLVGVAGGWHTHLAVLKDRLKGKEPGGFWKRYLEIEQEYDQRLPN